MSESEKKHRRQRHSLSPEFKAGAVKLVLEEGKSVAEVARNLDLTETALRRWVEQTKPDSGQGKPFALTVEVAAIHQQSRGTYGSPRAHAKLRARAVASPRSASPASHETAVPSIPQKTPLRVDHR